MHNDDGGDEVVLFPRLTARPYPQTLGDIELAWAMGDEFAWPETRRYVNVHDDRELMEEGIHEVTLCLPGVGRLRKRLGE